MLSRPPRNLAVAAGLIWSGLFAAAAQDGGRRFADSSDFVRIAGVVRMADQDRAIITLRVARGYHINANPASQPYLIPTTLVFAGSKAARVIYPRPTRFKPVFSDAPLDVYESIVAISAIFPIGALAHIAALHGAVTVQACSDRICFPPADLAFAERTARTGEASRHASTPGETVPFVDYRGAPDRSPPDASFCGLTVALGVLAGFMLRQRRAARAARQSAAETEIAATPKRSSNSPKRKGANAWATRAGAPSRPVRSPYLNGPKRASGTVPRAMVNRPLPAP